MPTVESMTAAERNGPLPWGLDVLRPPRRVLMRFILDQIEAGKGFPSRKAMQAHLGWADLSAVREALSTLCADGHLYRWPKPGAAKRTWVYGVVIDRDLIHEERE